MTILTRCTCISALTGLCLAMAAVSNGQVIINPGWESPANSAGGTDTNVTGWAMSPAPNPAQGYTNPGYRDSFYNNTPSGMWSFWLQTFTYQGSASQIVAGITAGNTYSFTSQMLFELGNYTPGGPATGYNAVTLANQGGQPNPSPNTGDLYSYISMQYLDHFGNPISGAHFETDIVAGSVTLNKTWSPYSVTGLAPSGATQVQLMIGWINGGQDGGTGGQSAFADDAMLAVVPEPSTFALLGLGLLPIARMLRRRN